MAAPPESDWKVFRTVRELALERFCKRTLDELQAIHVDNSRSHHDRYLEIFRVLRARDTTLASTFDNPRRSDMVRQLLAMVSLALIDRAELEPLSERTRATIELVLG